MTSEEKVNILLVDDQPAKLLSYEVVLRELGENLLKANSAREAFEHLLRTDVAVVLVDVCMPDLDGFELARMIREHPRFQQTAIIFISAVLLTDLDFLRGYECGAVDYVPVPVVPEILRAKVRIFAELFRKSRQLEKLNRDLERRVAERTADLEASSADLRESEGRLRLALEAARMGWWNYEFETNRLEWSPNLVEIMGFGPESFGWTFAGFLDRVHPQDRERFLALVQQGSGAGCDQACEIRFIRPDGSVRWSLAAGQVICDAQMRPARFTGVDLDITERKQAEERQSMLVRELDHRARNLLAVVQSVLQLSKADTTAGFIAAVGGRIKALSRAHTLLSASRWHGVDLRQIVEEEMAPFASLGTPQTVVAGASVSLFPATSQSLAMALHELATNAAKYGALSVPGGSVKISWNLEPAGLVLRWVEAGGPLTVPPSRGGFGTKVIVAGIEQQLGGSVKLGWHAEGLQAELVIPHTQINAPASAIELRQPGDGMHGLQHELSGSGARLLLVEDEALIGAMLRELLLELGFGVVGPLGNLTQALAAAQSEDICGAVLDVNLGGEQIYPVAEALAARHIPFVFVTGYSPAGIDRKFAAVPVIEKPVEPEALRQLLFRTGFRPVPSVAEPATSALIH